MLSVSCTAPRHAAKYAWLRKQGTVIASEREASLVNKNTPAAREGIQAETLEPVSATATADASVNLPIHPALASTGFEPTFGILQPTPEISSTQDSSYYDPEPRRWNVKAISALPIALTTVIVGIASQSIYLLLIGGAIAFALGLIGSRQCRDRGDRGKGFAIAGMALGAAALFFSLMVLIWAA